LLAAHGQIDGSTPNARSMFSAYFLTMTAAAAAIPTGKSI